MERVACAGHEGESEFIAMKVLVSAYACEPDKGSEPGVGWNWVKTIAEENEVWVLTRKNNRQSIERELSKNPMPNVHFEYVDLPRWISFFKKGQRGVRTYYYLWQFAALRQARRLDCKHKFNVGHHTSFVNDWLWTFFPLLSIPFVWGPIGSHPRIPWPLLGKYRSRFFDTMRFVFQCVVRVIDPLFWLSTIRARKVLLINKESLNLPPLSWLARNKAVIEPAIGVEDDLKQHPFRERSNVVFFFMGRFVPMKCPHIALDAFIEASNTNRDILFTMLGEGPMMSSLERKVESYGLSDRVKFIRWLPREDALSVMRDADVFLFPSTEGGGMVVLEALALGKPVICLDFGGPGEFIDETCGVKAGIQGYQDVVRSLASAVLRLGTDHELRNRLAEGARERSRRYHWGNKGVLINDIYKRIAVDR